MSIGIEATAKVCHEANRAYCEALGDWSHPHWSAASQPLKESVIAGIHELDDNPNLTPENLHEKWLDRKVREGWGYGRVKNEELKQHPNCIAYNHLPREERLKDDLFHAVARALLR